LARLLAAAALLGADLAVLHPVVAVQLALVAAAAACGDACPKHGASDVRVVSGLAADDPSRRRAYVRTVEIQANALSEFLHALLAEAVVRALGARLGAVTASLYTADQELPIDVELAGVRIEHVAGYIGDRHGDLLAVGL
jgi:hypothetical protein